MISFPVLVVKHARDVIFRFSKQTYEEVQLYSSRIHIKEPGRAGGGLASFNSLTTLFENFKKVSTAELLGAIEKKRLGFLGSRFRMHRSHGK